MDWNELNDSNLIATGCSNGTIAVWKVSDDVNDLIFCSGEPAKEQKTLTTNSPIFINTGRKIKCN